MKRTYEKVRFIPGLGKIATAITSPFTQNFVETVRQELDSISESFCAAKFLQVSLHLERGETHSCHHNPRHGVETDRPSGLHNTARKKEARQEMLQGARPADCSYCWEVEDLGGDPLSDRHYKSSEDWARPELKRLSKLKGDEDVLPTYVEVSFASVCQMKCGYCDPAISSAIRADFAQYGPLPGTYQAIEPVETSRHREAFWKWWPELASELHTLRVTGGEPLLQEDTFRLMDELGSLPRPKLSLSINSNLMVDEKVLGRFLEKVKGLLGKKAVKEIHLFASIDSWGEEAEYLRDGLSFPHFQKSLEWVLQDLPQMPVTLLITFNALSVFQYPKLMEYVVWLRRKYPKASLKVGASLLHYPRFLALDVLPREFAPQLAACSAAYGDSSFSPAERARFDRMLSWWQERPTAMGERENLKIFLKEYDQRRAKNAQRTFPELMKRLFL